VQRRTLLAVAAGLILAAPLAGCTSASRSETAVGSPAVSATSPSSTAQPSATVTAPTNGVRVVGARLVRANGTTVRLTGFNQSGTEYACIEGWGIFDAPGSATISPSVVASMASWRGANVVRVPLNEQCWLGIGVQPQYGGAAYQRAIEDYVAQLNRAGFLAVLDLHRNAPGNAKSLNQEQMPDRDHSIEFWRQVAQRFGRNGSVLFDLFNEPAPYGEADTDRAWACWRDGGCVLKSANSGAPYVAAGMNELISAIRSTGARNVLIAGGIYWAEMLDRWLEFQPSDPMSNLAASFHAYSFNIRCAAIECYQTAVATVSSRVPMLVGEIGPDLKIDYDHAHDHCAPADIGHTGFDETLFDWLDQHQISYTAWTFNKWSSCWALISDWAGTPEPIWGAFLRQRLAGQA
jgi:endoglucanase